MQLVAEAEKEPPRTIYSGSWRSRTSAFQDYCISGLRRNCRDIALKTAISCVDADQRVVKDGVSGVDFCASRIRNRHPPPGLAIGAIGISLNDRERGAIVRSGCQRIAGTEDRDPFKVRVRVVWWCGEYYEEARLFCPSPADANVTVRLKYRLLYTIDPSFFFPILPLHDIFKNSLTLLIQFQIFGYLLCSAYHLSF
jgi:hypothetical protein